LITFQDIPRRHADNGSRLLRHASCTPTPIRAQRREDKMTVKIIPNEKGSPPVKLAAVLL
jgi:hypothetical protein